ncbi:MAG: F0F1 ATP synthase subunit B [Gammaproteobacteria bacterium]|nr:F0F1 ATP synthase subunit B [Gammaproteobacteria bacterium]
MNINATILGQMIAFAFFVWFCMKYVWPPLTAAMAERQKKIADGLEAAERAEKDLELAQSRVADQLKEAKSEASGIIDQANKRATQIIDEAKEQAREEGQRLIAGAQAEIEQEVNRAKEQLRAQVASIAIAGAEKILEASIDENAHAELAEKLASSL